MLWRPFRRFLAVAGRIKRESVASISDSDFVKTGNSRNAIPIREIKTKTKKGPIHVGR
jgi:hypothetical protein